MKKFLELLEQHCQWLAVGLGGLFLAIVAWSFLLQAPVTHVAGQKSFTPGDVDTEVNKEIAASLERRISEQTVPPIADAKFDPRKAWIPVMDDAGAKTTALTHVWDSSTTRINERKGPEDTPKLELVATLPEVPPSEVLPQDGLKAARAFVAPVVAVGAAGAPPAAPIAGAFPPGSKDINYVRGEYRIDPGAIAAEWNRVNVPLGVTTSVLAVKVIRQEKLPNGKWGNETEVPLVANGVTIQPIPAAKNQQAENLFRGWSESPQGQADLLRPPFMQVVQGEGPWDAPIELLVKDAETIKRERLEKAKLEADERARQRAEQLRNRPQPQPTAPEERRGRRGREEGFLANDPSRPDSLADLAGLQLAQVPPPNLANVDENGDPIQPGGMGGQPPVPAGQGQPQQAPLPAPKFDPRQTQPIFGWFYDTTVVEGHTYRYQVLYSIMNPMYLDNRVANQADAMVFELKSKIDENAWSEERTIDTSTHYFLAVSNWQNNSVPGTLRVEVYKWAAGKWQVRNFVVAPGDQIGGKEMGVDYSTASTLVDVRYDDRNSRAYAVFLAPDGQLVEREPIADRDNGKRAALNGIIKGLAPAVPAPGMGMNMGGNGQAPMAGR